MKCYEHFVQTKGFKVNYIEAHEQNADVRQLISSLATEKVSQINLIDPVDDWLLSRVKSAAAKLNIKLQVLDSSMYLNTEADLAKFFNPDKKTYFQTAFYMEETFVDLLKGLKDPELLYLLY